MFHSSIPLKSVFRLAVVAKKYDIHCYIVIGGFNAAAIDQKILQTKRVYAVVCGEGETTFDELCNAILNQGSFSNVEGISYSDGEHIIMNPNRSFMDLKELPVLARELYPLERIYDLNGSVDSGADVRAAWICYLGPVRATKTGIKQLSFRGWLTMPYSRSQNRHKVVNHPT